jgi:hypothetical protein
MVEDSGNVGFWVLDVESTKFPPDISDRELRTSNYELTVVTEIHRGTKNH